GYFSLNLSANSVMRGRLDARRTLKSLVADLRIIQKKISNILQSLDEKIELNCRINENLEQQAQALFKSWFVDGTNIELNYHELGNITSITAGGDKPSIYSKELTEKYYTPIYSNGIENEGLYGYTDFAKINSSSITISARGTIGYICLRTKPYVPIVRLISVIPKKEELSAEYLYLWALRQNFSATGTTQQQLTVPNLKKISIGIPAKEILKKFNNIVIPIFQSIEKNKDENKNLAQLRDTLLPKLMSGELKLSEIKTKLYE
ncbi:MAG: restriction endonuclease subunit S, partial [Bacteroides sp.]|nr:restriction endonuclease subunit S [Bacteroides sp.]MBS4826321.1 restriction endonuclease subunit S [Bacteroides sp.]